MAGRDLFSVFPGIINFSPQPFKDPVRFFFILKGIDRDLPWLNGDEPAIDFEGHRRRVFQVFKSSKHRVEIRQRLADVLTRWAIQCNDSNFGLHSSLKIPFV